MEIDLLELAEQVSEQIKKQGSLEFSVKKQGHRLDILGNSSDKLQLQVKGCVNQWVVVTSTLSSTLSSVATNVNSLIYPMNDFKKKS